MHSEIYQFDISRADRALDLHSMIDDIHGDETLDSAEKEALVQFIHAKIARLKPKVGGTQKPH